MLVASYIVITIFISIYSWGFVDIHSPFPVIKFLYDFVHFERGWATAIYAIFFAVLFLLYTRVLWLVKKKQIQSKTLFILIAICVGVLFVGFPGFSYDVFNYMATARMTFLYHENPYIIMPIEILHEPMLQFMHAANKLALYGPVWILMTFIPYAVGFGNLLLTVFAFKAYILLFYIAFLYVLWRISGKNLFSFAFFGLNPVVLSETVLSGHNDIVMMFFALCAFYLLQKRSILLSLAAFICSVFIKYATVLLVPMYFYVIWRIWRNEKVHWRSIWFWSAIAMYAAFLLSPVREEIYSWYFIWPLSFVALLDSSSWLTYLAYGFSFGLPYRLAPFIYSEEWGGLTPMIKKAVTFIFPSLSSCLYVYTKKRT